MTRLKSILGCDGVLELHEKYDGCVFRTIRAVEQAVLAKLAGQEPVAWTSAEIISDPSFVDDDDYAVMYRTKSHLLDDFCGYPEATPVPLYANPMPCVSPTSDKTACVSESAESEAQTTDSQTKGMSLGERIAHVGGRENENGYVEFGSVMAVHALINHVIRDLWGSKQGILNSSDHNQVPKEPYRTTKNCVELISKSIRRPPRVGYGWDDESTPSNKIIIQLMAKYHLQMLMGSDYEKVMDFGRDVFNFAAKSHTPDAGKTVCENCQYLPDGSSLVDEVKVMVEMLEDKEWAEHIGKTELGIRLERVVSALHNELLEVQGRHIFIDGGGVPDGWQLVPKEPTEEMHLAARDWSVSKYGKAIGFNASLECYASMLAAAPKYTGEK